MPTRLESKDLINTQQMEVAVNGPDGANHLILCTGIANLGSCSNDTFTFLVGPSLSKRQFVGVIASGALSTIQIYEISDETDPEAKLSAKLVAIYAAYDEESGRVRAIAEVISGVPTLKLAISYNVSILAELPRY